MVRREGGAVRSEQLTLGTMALRAANILGVGVPPLVRRRADKTGAVRTLGRMSRAEGQRGKAVEGPAKKMV